jgi:hypothetical protein
MPARLQLRVCSPVDLVDPSAVSTAALQGDLAVKVAFADSSEYLTETQSRCIGTPGTCPTPAPFGLPFIGPGGSAHGRYHDTRSVTPAPERCRIVA